MELMAIKGALILTMLAPPTIASQYTYGLSTRSNVCLPPELRKAFVEPPTQLNLTYAQYRTVTPGQALPINTTLNEPSLGLGASSARSNGSYVALMVDSSVNLTNSTTNLLHWLQTDLVLSASMLANQSAPIANYLSPIPLTCPPPAHDYTVMLFEQPSNFSLPASYRRFASAVPGGADILAQLASGKTDNQTQVAEGRRADFPIVDFVHQSGLGQPLAMTWFQVSLPPQMQAKACNSTASGAASTPAPKATGSANSTSANRPHSSGGNGTVNASTVTATSVAGASTRGIQVGLVVAGGMAFGFLV